MELKFIQSAKESTPVIEADDVANENVWIPFAVDIERAGPDVAKVWIDDVLPFRDVTALTRYPESFSHCETVFVARPTVMTFGEEVDTTVDVPPTKE